MTALPGTTAPRGTGARNAAGFAIGAAVKDVVATLGYVPVALVATMQQRMFDLSAHHRLSTLKNIRTPRRIGGQRFLARVYTRYHNGPRLGVADNRKPLEGLNAARLMRRLPAGATVRHGMFVHTRESDRLFELLERGGVADAGSGFFAIRLRRPGTNRFHEPDLERFNAKLRRRVYDVTRRGLLVETLGHRGAQGVRSRVVGVLRRRRSQAPMLGYNRQFDSVLPRQRARLDTDLDRLVGVANTVGRRGRRRPTATDDAFVRSLGRGTPGSDPDVDRQVKAMTRSLGSRLRSTRVVQPGAPIPGGGR